MKIRLTGASWGVYGTPDPGTVVEAVWHGGFWTFGEDQLMASETGGWAAEEVKDEGDTQ